MDSSHRDSAVNQEQVCDIEFFHFFKELFVVQG